MKSSADSKQKAEPDKKFRVDWAGWTDRVLIVTLGLTIGLSAKWIKQTWQANHSQPAQSAPEVPTSRAP